MPRQLGQDAHRRLKVGQVVDDTQAIHQPPRPIEVEVAWTGLSILQLRPYSPSRVSSLESSLQNATN
jgi:hypothetical protein